jgi:hypothetical protein
MILKYRTGALVALGIRATVDLPQAKSRDISVENGLKLWI